MTAQLDLFSAVAGINDFGVLVDDDQCEIIRDPKRTRMTDGWEIRAARFPDGLWRSAADYGSPTFGFLNPLSIDSTPFKSRDDAVLEACRIIDDRVSREPVNSLTTRVLTAIRKLSSSITGLDLEE